MRLLTTMLTLSGVLTAGVVMSGTDAALAADKPEARKPDGKVFEMRIYHAEPGKMDALNKRFSDITNKYFAKYGMTPVGYWLDAKEPEKKLYYILSFPSLEAAKESWDKFRKDPERVKEFAETEKNGKLVAKIESIWLTATDYSAIK